MVTLASLMVLDGVFPRLVVFVLLPASPRTMVLSSPPEPVFIPFHWTILRWFLPDLATLLWQPGVHGIS